jgi:Fe2+ transport system protein FeoA
MNQLLSKYYLVVYLLRLYNKCYNNYYGALAQLGARLTGSQEVTGSNPVCSTIFLRRDMKLNELKQGQSATIESVGGSGALRQHFLDMGIIPGACISLTKHAPMGDPIEFRIHGYELTLRLADARHIEVQESGENLSKDATPLSPSSPGPVFREISHPGHGRKSEQR